MSEEVKKTFQEKLEEAINGALDSGEMVLKWTAQIEVMEVSGETGLWTLSSNDLAPWAVLGMLEYALNRERELSKLSLYMGLEAEEDE